MKRRKRFGFWVFLWIWVGLESATWGLMDSELNYVPSSAPGTGSSLTPQHHNPPTHNLPPMNRQCHNFRASWMVPFTLLRHTCPEQHATRTHATMAKVPTVSPRPKIEEPSRILTPPLEMPVRDLPLTSGTHTQSSSKPPPTPPNDEIYVVKAIPRNQLPPQPKVDPPPIVDHLAGSPTVEEGDSSPEETKSNEVGKDPNNVVQEMDPLVGEKNLTKKGSGNPADDVTANNTEPDIPSFSEWAQKALEEEEKKKEEKRKKVVEEKEKMKQQQQQNGKVSSSHHAPPPPSVMVPNKALKKNFASLDCGAKVVGANSESQGASNIISTSRDEYMLNTCTDSAWFVVELCESIKAFKVEIANFELYSSVPHEFRVWLGGNYPARDKDWVLFGQFQAKDERTVQTFTSQESVFGKYAKIEILSHHGSEHYCPISMFRIFGISEIELIGRDDDDDDDDDDDHQQNIHQPPTEAALELEKEPPKKKDIVSFIKEKVDETIERVVGVFRTSDQFQKMDVALNESSLIGNSFVFEVHCPGCEEERYRDVYYLLATKYNMLKSSLQIPALRTSLMNWACRENGFEQIGGPKHDHGVCIGYQLMDFHRTLFGSSRTIALCNILLIDQGISKFAHSLVDSSASKNTQTLDLENAKSNWTGSDPGDQLSSVKDDQNSRGNAQAQAPIGDDGSLPLPPNRQNDFKGKPDETNRISPSDEQPDNAADRNKTEDIENAFVAASDGTPHGQTVIIEKGAKNGEDRMNGNPIKNERSKQTESEQLSANDAHVSKTAHAQSINSQQQKESVWQKLTNKIKTLERNVTLSSGYLEELSVRYKKQIEDLQFLVRQSSDALAQTNGAAAEDRAQLLHLQTIVKELTLTLENLTTQVETVGIWGLGFHLIFLIVEIVVGFIIYSCILRGSSRRRPSVSSEKRDNDAVHFAIPFHKSESTAIDDDNRRCQDPQANRHLRVENDPAVHRGRRRKSLDFNLPNGNLSKKQRKRMQRRLNKVSSASRVQDLILNGVNDDDDDDDREDALPNVYYTFQPGDRKLYRSSDRFQLGGDSDSSPETSRESRSQRFRVKKVAPDIPLPSLPAIQVRNMFGALDNSVHDDPTPVKQRSLQYQQHYVERAPRNGHLVLLTESEYENEDEQRLLVNGRSHRSRLKGSSTPVQYRSKSTSPLRIGQTAKQKALFKNFDPDKADWISNKKSEYQIQAPPPNAVLVLR
ncbi:uncharacterized protein LOC131889236 isoform X2 [Tigriopus californicus]|uniref:uncharacterized protein LOC131889236 isoform X2 n=1 Tax=Tigriopus californicus TaxID=6832 RepID=UPI0027DAA052|nr:uncharacterized protein LOC131889236 isoform X2 [Tigriopus californicus]